MPRGTDLLLQVPCLAGVDIAELERIPLRRVEFAAGEWVFTPHSSSLDLFFVAEGVVEIFDAARPDELRRVTRAVSGDVLGEHRQGGGAPGGGGPGAGGGRPPPRRGRCFSRCSLGPGGGAPWPPVGSTPAAWRRPPAPPWLPSASPSESGAPSTGATITTSPPTAPSDGSRQYTA